MKRIALLISHPGELGEENYLAVDKDIEGWKGHLLSPLGGGWREAEIRMLSSPSLFSLQNEIQKWREIVEYAFIVFSGHGDFSSRANDTILQINSTEEIPSKRLRLAKRETVVLDCCRKVRERRLFESASLESHQSKAEFPHPDYARRAFEIAVNRCEEAVLVLHSCNIDEVAYDDDFGRGGAYSFALINAAKDWQPGRELEPQKGAAYSVVAAHNKAVVALADSEPGRQNPQIKKPRSSPYFPISIWV